MNKRTQNKIEREKKMIEAAMHVFDMHGIENTKMTDIAKQADIGVASLYRYFTTKIELALAVGVAYWAFVYDYLTQVDVTGLDGMATLRRLMCIYTDDDPKLTSFFRFIEQLDGFITKVDVPEEGMAAYEAAILKVEPLFEAILKRGYADGSIRTDLDIHKHYTMITHAITALKQKHCNRGIVISIDTEESLKEEIHVIIEIFLGYLIP